MTDPLLEETHRVSIETRNIVGEMGNAVARIEGTCSARSDQIKSIDGRVGSLERSGRSQKIWGGAFAALIVSAVAWFKQS